MATSTYFYPHGVLRERHLDTIRNWPGEVANRRAFETVRAKNVAKKEAFKGRVSRSWKQLLPLPNLKRRPVDAPREAIVYVWGALMTSGDFICDLDNPYSLVGYQLEAMRIWRPILAMLLRSRRCIEIRCMSAACQRTLQALFGDDLVEKKSRVVYPCIPRQISVVDAIAEPGPRFLFVGSQFEMKGGPELLRAFAKVRESLPMAQLDMVTHFPPKYVDLANQPGVVIHPADLPRERLWSELMRTCDVLVHPTYVDSFGMVVLEALAHGLAVVSTDVYALNEMVENGVNGYLIDPPVSIWNGVLPSDLYYHLDRVVEEINKVETSGFEASLAETLLAVGSDPERLLSMRRQSLALLDRRFQA